MGWDELEWARVKVLVLVDNLARLEGELVKLEDGERGQRLDKVLMEAVGSRLQELMQQALSGQWRWEALLGGRDARKEELRRRGLHLLAVNRGWVDCVHCGEWVPPEEWATGRWCAHQYHRVRIVH